MSPVHLPGTGRAPRVSSGRLGNPVEGSFLQVWPRVPGRDPATPTAFGYGATGASDTTLRATLSPSGQGAAQTADLAAINNALSAANSAGGGVVKLNAGTFYVNGRILIPSNVALIGARAPRSAPTTVIKAGTNFLTNPRNGGYSVITTVAGASNITVRDLLADQSGDTLDGNITGRLSAYCVEARSVTNALLDGVFTRNAFTYNIVSVDSVQVGIRNCDVLHTMQGRYDQVDGIHILQGHDIDVVDNRVDNGAGGTTGDGDDGLVAHTIGSTLTRVQYRNNWVRGGRHGHGLQLAGGSFDITEIDIVDNVFVGTSTPRGVRFGYYGSATSAVSGIRILRNRFEDCGQLAVSLTDGPHSNCRVEDNTSVRSGGYFIDSGNGNTNLRNS